MDAILAALWQLAETPHTDSGRWFLIGALVLLFIGGVLLVVRGLMDLRQGTEPERKETAGEDRKKAA